MIILNIRIKQISFECPSECEKGYDRDHGDQPGESRADGDEMANAREPAQCSTD